MYDMSMLEFNSDWYYRCESMTIFKALPRYCAYFYTHKHKVEAIIYKVKKKIRRWDRKETKKKNIQYNKFL